MSAELFNRDTIYSQHGLPAPTMFRKLTREFRIKPKLFIVGVQKAGTTSLANYLSALPGVIAPWEKEISFFNNDARFQLGEDWYRSFFATRFTKNILDKKHNISHITFDATANYFEEIKSAQRIKSFDPEAKVIVILRNPVYRAWSHYKMAVRYGFETRSFKDALSLEAARIASNDREHNFAFQRLGYRTKGEYINFLPEWMETFGKNITVVFYESLFGNNIDTLNDIHAFLDLKARPSLGKLQHHNRGNESLIDKADEQNLKDHYAPFNEQLSQYLKTKLPW